MAASAARRRHEDLDLVIVFPPNKMAGSLRRPAQWLKTGPGDHADRRVWILARLPVYRHRYLRHLPNFRHMWQVPKNRIARKNR
jgi:hypothetical protein